MDGTGLNQDECDILGNLLDLNFSININYELSLEAS
jgi:hypothetical protein